MKQISANITGSFILNGVDLTTTIESSSIWSGSIASRVSSLEQFSSSLDSTYATDAQLNSVTQSVNTLSSSFLSYTSSTDDKIAQLNRETASLNLATASLYAATASLYAATASINSYTSSNNDSIADIRVTTASLYAATASINSYTASNNNNVAALYAATASLYNATASIYGATSSLFSYSASATLRINALDQYTASLNTRSASFACVDSTNNFACTQYFSNTSNAVSFTSTGSLYSDGGMRITKDMYVSGTAFFNNVTVFGTQSVAYISSSQLNIGTNIISVNTDTPSVRFGGLAVYDSGSTGLTGSMLWDSEANHWVYSNPSGSSYSGGMFISGPRSAALGSEQGTTACMLMMGQGGDHITSSAIYHSSTITCIGNSKIAGNLNVAGNSCLGEGNLFISTDSTFDTRASYTFRDAAGINNPNGLSYCAADTVLSVGSRSNGNSIITTGNIGVGTACPTVQLQVIGTIAAGADLTGWGRMVFDTDVFKLQASKNGVDPIGLSFWTQASGGAFAERMRIACDGKVGIGTTTPSAELQINKNCDAVIAISSCVGVTTGNRGALAFYNCATSTVGLIRATAVTDNVGTQLEFHTRPAGGSLTQVLTLGNTGVASFACQVCASSLSICGNAVLSRTSTSAGANVEFRTAGTLNWYLGTRGLVNNNFYIVNEGLSGLSNVIIDATTGATTFACQISTPTIIANNSSGFAACVTSCSTDYSMYVRNMSSGFPLSIYTNGDSNGVNDDLKALKIARASNDNQFLAVSLIYGGFGYGYKFAPRYYNGSAYVCGAPTVIDSYGNIGINCTAPFMPLTVKGCASIDKLVVNGTCFNSFGEHLQINGCARLFYGQFRVSSGPNDSNYMFLTHDDVNGYLCINRTIYAGNMILAPFGGVGINTSVVSSKLTVNSGINTSSANVLTLQQATNGANKDAAAFGLSIQNGGESTNAADLYISTATGGALCERMRITSGGLVGIGASSPSYQLDISGGTTVNQRIRLQRGSDDTNQNMLLGWNNIVVTRHNVSIAGNQTDFSLIQCGSDGARVPFYIAVGGQACFACNVIANGDFNIRNTSFSTTGTLNKVTWTNLYPSTYNVADIGVQLDGNYYNGAIIFRTADADNANVLVERMRMESRGATCFRNTVYSPAFCQPSGFTVYSFPIDYGVSFCDVSSGNYLSVGGTEPGTINSYCAYAHGGISPRAVAANTEGMSWTCLRFVLRVLSPVGDTVGTPTYLQTAGYFYTTGWYGLGTCTNIAGVMDGSRGYSTVVLPWIPFSSFTGAGDVTGFGIRNVGPTTTRIGSVYIQYK